MTEPRFAILEHTADIGLEAYGPTPGELFRQAALGLLAIAVDDAAIAGSDVRPLQVAGDDFPSLLVNFLEEVLYEFDSNRFAARDCEIEAISPTAVSARLVGEPRVPERHRWKLIVKAVTYHGLEVKELDGGWRARVFLDI
jgi:SHS2 domain-containing protein